MLAYLAPGQGAQNPGMLNSWLADGPAKELLKMWSDAIDLDLLRLGTLAEGDEIKDTSNAQPLIVAAGLLGAKRLNGRLNGELHKSNPIRLKNVNEPTTWTDEVTVEFPETVMPQFTWSDFGEDNDIYFEVISESEDETFLSGTYTNDTFFKYLDNANVVLDINEDETPEDLVEDTEYLFTMMAVSEDNWVNTVIEETFIPRNLEEYLEVHATKTIEVATAFAASASESTTTTYIYYHPLVGVSDMRYYETDGASDVAPDFSEYRKKSLTDEAVYEGNLRRYTRTDSEESWCIVTYVIGDILYKSEPIKIKIDESPTEWFTETDDKVTIDTSER